MKLLIYALIILSITTFSCQRAVTDKISEVSKIQNVTNENLDGTITIQGKVTVKGTNNPPVGITTMNVLNKWVTKADGKQFSGENKNVYVDKNGYYNITIQKGDTLVLIPNQYLYDNFRNYRFTNLQQSQILNIEINQDLQKLEKLKNDTPIVFENLQKFLLDSEKADGLVTVAGTVYSEQTKKPLKDIVVLNTFLRNTKDTGAYHLTNDTGQFFLVVPKNKEIAVNPLSPNNNFRFSANQDTIVNIFLKN